jgi:hypothetical protein
MVSGTIAPTTSPVRQPQKQHHHRHHNNDCLGHHAVHLAHFALNHVGLEGHDMLGKTGQQLWRFRSIVGVELKAESGDVLGCHRKRQVPRPVVLHKLPPFPAGRLASSECLPIHPTPQLLCHFPRDGD